MNDETPTPAEAREIVLHELERVDNVFPWWQKLRGPLVMIGVAILGLMLTVLMLVRVVYNNNESQKMQDKQDACRNLYSDQVSAGLQVFLQAGFTTINNFNKGLLLLSEQKGGQIDVQALQEGIDRSNDASVDYAAALDARTAWLAAGSPIPCPIGVPPPPAG